MALSDKDEARVKELLGPSGGGGSAPSADSETSGGSYGEVPGDFTRGVVQSGLNWVEGPAQWAEQGIRHLPGVSSDFKLPLHDWAAGFRRRAESSPAGIAGEVAGTAAPFFFGAGEAGAAVRGAGLASDLERMAAASRGFANYARAVPGVARAGEAIGGAARAAGGAARGAGERIAEAANRARPAEDLPNPFRIGPEQVPRAASLASRAGGGINRAIAGYHSLSPAARAGLRGGAQATFFMPKDSEHFGREAAEDFVAGNIFGRLGNIGERIRPGGEAVESLYRQGEIPPVFRQGRPPSGRAPQQPPYWREPKTREAEELSPRARSQRATGAAKAWRDMTDWERQELRRSAFSPRQRAAQRGQWKRNYPEEARIGGMGRMEDARRQYERALRNWEFRRNLPHQAAHFAWHLPFLMGHGPIAARYFGASILSHLARQWARRMGRRGAPTPTVDIEDVVRRNPMIASWLNRISPYGLGALGGQAVNQTGGVSPYIEGISDYMTGADDGTND
jgi:hypothetical protein